jgi:hypothetical protein
MATNPKHERDQDDRYEHDNDNAHKRGGQAVAPAPAAGALTSLAALETALANVDTSSAVGRSGLPMLQFKRDGDGTWSYGQRRIVVEDGSPWAVNPLTFRWGYICFSDNNKVVGERLVSVSQPKPELTELPDRGYEWQEQWAVQLKCTGGADAGTEVIYKPTTVGGIQAIAGLIEVVRDRLSEGKHGGKVAPIVHLEKDSYSHSQHGRVWTPLLPIVDWMPLNGPAPTPTPTPPSPANQDQPRRRRVA